MEIKPLIWDRGVLSLLDQRELPSKETYLKIDSLESAHRAIKAMAVRGAPLIGLSAIYGLALGLLRNPKTTLREFLARAAFLKTARPTAVNLEFEIDRCLEIAQNHHRQHGSLKGLVEVLERWADDQWNDLESSNLKMAQTAEQELSDLFGLKQFNLVTLCNTGVLACGPRGTALGVVSHLHERRRLNHVYACETRPWLQGSRLTAFELAKQGIDHSLIVEGAQSYLMQNRPVDAALIGADRIAANGDTANKIGSSVLAIVCRHHNVPFFVVAPLSSFDFSLKDGGQIPIEQRPPREVLEFRGNPVAPAESGALNPGFDITDHKLIHGIICEKGVVRPNQKDGWKCLEPA